MSYSSIVTRYFASLLDKSDYQCINYQVLRLRLMTVGKTVITNLPGRSRSNLQSNTIRQLLQELRAPIGPSTKMLELEIISADRIPSATALSVLFWISASVQIGF